MSKKINEIIQNPLSSNLIAKYFNGRPNIITMQQISTMTSLNEVFRNHDHAVIFTATNSPTDGHWQMIYKSNGCINWFDSYGMKPTELISKLEQKGNTWGQNKNLDNLIINSPYRLKSFFNDVKYQKDGNVQTCGRYVSLVFILIHIYQKRNLGFDGSVFYKIMEGLRKQYNASYDQIVSSLIDTIDLSSF